MNQTQHLTLLQLAVLRGFSTQKALLEAIEEAGHTCPQPELSAMYRGGESYPKARRAVAAALEITEQRLLEHIRNTGR